jgi:hypothetical protein
MLREAPQLDAPTVVGSVRRLARNRIAVESERLREWLAALDPEARATPIAAAIADELAQHEARDRQRRARSWLP